MNTKYLKPWQFLSLVFMHLNRNAKPEMVSFVELQTYRDYLKEKYDIDVDWDHDNYLYCFGFYKPVFEEYKNKNGSTIGVVCNYSKLKFYYKDIISAGTFVPNRREIRFIQKQIYKK